MKKLILDFYKKLHMRKNTFIIKIKKTSKI